MRPMRALASKTATQLMQNLVPSRCRPSRPFENIGVDYAGPYQVREAIHFPTRDNGTNFVGAGDFVTACQSPELRDRCADLKINWSFYPPGAPHLGGMQEAAVRSVKHHLRRIIGTFTPTAEEMETLLCKVEATLNSRPLTRIRDDADCLEILTPGHFLTGSPLNTRPTSSVADVPISRLTRWRTLQKFHELLWKHWSREYLQELQTR
ncbi:uncharacterized protein LOC143363335 [Halictus rubicundus]|uniref:uncharacterized protein LOC143363335 n=1 Tax=Halictus rubicundus TaxID=77578 RepID=UPI004037429A